jgi:hypothetical protein
MQLAIMLACRIYRIWTWNREMLKRRTLNAIYFFCAVHGFLNPGCRLSELERKGKKNGQFPDY